MKRRFALALSFGLFFSNLQGSEVHRHPADEQNYGDAVVLEVTSVHDGDTFRANVDGFAPLIGHEIPIRIAGIDTPEMNDPRPDIRQKAEEARKFVLGILRQAKKIELKNLRRDRYFRIDADVLVDGNDLATMLLDNGLARRYDGFGPKPW